MILPFLCLVLSVHDGDTLRCQDGTRVRIAGIESNELSGGCHLPVCAAMPAQEARETVRRMVEGKTLRCVQVGTSYKRVVARCMFDGRDLRCAIVATQAAVDWPAYVRRYGLGRCG